MSIELADFKTLALTRVGPVLHVTLSRPAQANAMSMVMVRELGALLAQAEMDGRTRVIVLRGAGGHFCAGADAADLAAARMRMAVDPSALIDVSTAVGNLCVAYADTPLVLIAVLEGMCMGGGFGLACVADVVLADESVEFRLPEASRGEVPAAVLPFLMQRVGYSDARRLGVTGASVRAAEALALRLVHEVHAENRLDSALGRVLDEVLQNAPGAVAATKALLARARLAQPAALVHAAAEAGSRAALGAEAADAADALRHLRKAPWVPD